MTVNISFVVLCLMHGGMEVVSHGRDFNASQPTDLVESLPVAMRYDFRDSSISCACRSWYQQVQPDTPALAHERRVQSW